MEGSSWRPAARVPAEPAAVDSAWRSQLQAGVRQCIVNKIMDTLKLHVPISVPEGISELKKIAVRFEEKIYAAATNQTDYLRKISLKMMSMETKIQGSAAINPPLSNPVVGNQNPADSGISVDDMSTVLCLNGCNKRERTLANKGIIDCEVYSPFIDDSCSKRKKVMTSPPQPDKVVPKEPIFTCPVCINELVEACSTICGHVFCQSCIKLSIQKQKKCPTCRKALNIENFHRVYLPTAN